MFWMLLVLLYGLLKGSREIAKKKAMTKNTVMEVLVAYTFLSFVFVIPQAPKAGGLEPEFYFYIALKSFAIFIAWICSFYSIKKLPVSLYGILDLSRVLFATALGVFALGETLGIFQIAGLIIVCTGLLLLKFKPPFLKKLFKVSDSRTVQNPDADSKKNLLPSETTNSSAFQNEAVISESNSRGTGFYVILALISCMLNAVSGFLDKVLMHDISSSQLQFWYMAFLISYYIIYMLIFRKKFSFSVFKNGWVWLLAVMFVIGDKALFIANGMTGSKITIMTLIKQSGCIVTILGGKFIFKEKNTAYRFFCAAVIITGIVLGVLR